MCTAAMRRSPKKSRPFDRHVGARIRLRRGMLGVSQVILAERIGVSFQQVQKYENGVNRVSAGRLQQISEVLESEPAWFFDGAPEFERGAAGKAVDAEMATFLNERLAPTLIRGFPKLAPKFKDVIAELIALSSGIDVEA